MVRHKRRKTIWAYLDDEKLVDVAEAALDNNMTVDDLKQKLVRENPGHKVTFKVELKWNSKEVRDNGNNSNCIRCKKF